MPANSFQLKGAATQKQTVRDKVAKAVTILRKELRGSRKGTVLSFAAVARQAEVSPKTLREKYHSDSAELIRKLVSDTEKSASSRKSVSKPPKEKQPTYFQRLNSLAQEAEVIRFKLQTQIDELKAEAAKQSRQPGSIGKRRQAGSAAVN
jgi:hypothetical protein